VAAIDSYTMYYERDPDQHRTWSTPVAIPQVQAPSYSEQAVLPV
jgi:hypothetical protein